MSTALGSGAAALLRTSKAAAAGVVGISVISLVVSEDFLPWRGARVVIVSFVLGAIPFSYLFARSLAGVDLRTEGTGTVSGTGLYRVTGLAALVSGGGLDVLKGMPGVLAAGGSSLVAALAAGAAVAGHNWSPFLGGSGGRGFSVAMGAMATVAWPATALMAGALLAGRLARQSAIFSLASLLAMPPLALRTHGGWASLAGWLIVGLMLAKRLVGNHPPPPGAARWGIYRNRLLFDNDRAT